MANNNISMDKLHIPSGGMPFEGDDLDYINAGIVDAMRANYFHFGQPYSGNFIISGCAISFAAGFASVTAGYVMLDWEICYCPAQTVGVTSLAASSLKLGISYDSAGTEVFADSVSRETYQRRRAVISDGLNGGIEIPLDTTVRYHWAENVNTFNNDWEAQPGFTVKATKIGEVVYLSGAITAGQDNLTAFVLPAVFRPTSNRYMRTAQGNTIVFSDGNVFVADGTDGQNEVTGLFAIDCSYVL